ncbi:MAG: DUF3037 domain-containing protein [Gemmatimonadota bacterium]|nr:DUF3037 domain-containing protein [Gemmatimonadota bacterium]
MTLHSRNIPYNFAVLRVVPHVHIGSAVPVGVILHAPTEKFVGMRVLVERAALSSRVPAVDTELLARYLVTYRAASNAEGEGGTLAFGSPSERFHWLTAPRSDVIQSGPVHEGVCDDLDAELDALFLELVV